MNPKAAPAPSDAELCNWANNLNRYRKRSERLLRYLFAAVHTLAWSRHLDERVGFAVSTKFLLVGDLGGEGGPAGLGRAFVLRRIGILIRRRERLAVPQ